MRHIYCENLCADEAAEAAAFVLDDFKDAYGAYEHMSSSVDEDPSFEFLEDTAKADVTVLVFTNPDKACEGIAHLSAGTKVYGICLGDLMPSQALAGLETACKQKSCTWQGLLLITKEPRVVSALQKKPRLGWWRRKLSEGIDRLIACVRAGVSVQEAPDLFGATKKQRVQAARNFMLVS